jgi:hypothetical protein
MACRIVSCRVVSCLLYCLAILSWPMSWDCRLCEYQTKLSFCLCVCLFVFPNRVSFSPQHETQEPVLRTGSVEKTIYSGAGMQLPGPLFVAPPPSWFFVLVCVFVFPFNVVVLFVPEGLWSRSRGWGSANPEVGPCWRYMSSTDCCHLHVNCILCMSAYPSCHPSFPLQGVMTTIRPTQGQILLQRHSSCGSLLSLKAFFVYLHDIVRPISLDSKA